MSKIVTDKNGVSKSTAVPKVKTTTKSRTTGVSVGEIKGSQKPTVPTATKTVKPQYKPVNGKVVDVSNGYTFTEGGADDPAVMNGSREKTTLDPNEAKGDIQLGYNEMKKNAEDLDVGPVYGSFDEQVKDTIKKQREQKALQEKMLAEQEAANKYNSKKEIASVTSGASTAASALRNSREGFFSNSNVKVGEKIQAAATGQVKRIQEQRDTAQAQIDQAKQDLQTAELQGNTELAQQYTDVIAAAQLRVDESNARIEEHKTQGLETASTILNTLSQNGMMDNLTPEQVQDLQDALPNAPPILTQIIADASAKKGVANEAQVKLDNSIKGIDALGKIFGSGSELSTDQVLGLADSLGLGAEDAISLYKSYEATRNTKGLTDEQIRIQNADALETAKQKQRGEFTLASQNMAFLQKMYKEDYPQEAIDAFSRAAGFNDPTQDPLYIAQAALEAANAVIAEKHSRGIPTTPQDMIDLAKAQKDLAAVDPNADPWSDAVIPNNPIDGFSVTFEDGALQITTKPGAKYQCGAGVNRAWGLSNGTGVNGNGGMPSEISGKKELVDKNGYTTDSLNGDYSKIVPGMAFVMETFDAGSKPYGHTGLIKTTPDEKGNFTTEEWNADGVSETHSIKTRNVRDMYGFALPPEGTFTNVNGGDKGSLSDAISLGYRTEAQQKMYRSMKSRGEEVPSLLDEEKGSTFIPETYKDNPQAAPYASAFSMIKFKSNDDKVAASEVMKTLIDQGDYVGAREQLEGYALNSASPKQQDVMSGKANTIATMEGIQTDIDKFIAEGGDLGIFTGLTEDTLQQFGFTSNPKLSVLANDIASALFQYRKDLTGAVFSAQESKEYEKQYPSIGKTPELSKTKIDSIIKAARRQQDAFYEGKLGATKYKAIKKAAGEQAKNTATPEAELSWQQRLYNKLNPQKEPENLWDTIDTESGEDILSNFDSD